MSEHRSIEQNMAFLLSRNLKKALGSEEAVSHLSKARNLLVNAGLLSHSAKVEEIIKRAMLSDDSDIEVTA